MGVGCSSDNSIGVSLQDKIPSYKILLVGDPGVGKTSIFLRYIKHQFNYDYVPTTQVAIENVVRKLNVPENAVVSVTMWDLPGREDMDLRKTYYQDVDAAIVVTDLTSVDSIELAPTWKSEILNKAVRLKHITETDKDGVTKILSTEEMPIDPKQLPILLVGNKYDLIAEKLEAEKVKKDEEKHRYEEETFKLALALKLNEQNKQQDPDGAAGSDYSDQQETEEEHVEMANDVEQLEGENVEMRNNDNGDDDVEGGNMRKIDIEEAASGDSGKDEKLIDEADQESNGKQLVECQSEEGPLQGTLNPTEPSQQTDGDNEEEKPECVQLLEAISADHGFLESFLISAKDADGSVHACIQSLIRHLLQRNVKVNVKKVEKEKKLKKKDLSNEEWSMKETGLKQFDDLFHRINVFMERGHLYNGYYTLALSKFKKACLDAEVVTYIHESHCSIEDCISGLKSSIGTGDDLKSEEEEEFLYLEADPHIKVDLSIQAVLRTFNSEYAAISKAILREYPTLAMALQKLDEKVSTESEKAWDIMTEAGRTQMDVRKISGTVEKNRAQVALMLKQISQYLNFAENAKKKITAALLW